MLTELSALQEQIQQESAFLQEVLTEVGKTIVGQRAMVERLLVGLLTGGHVLLEGVPGLAKTLTIKTLSDTIQADFKRIQFTPDLLPADVMGTMIYNQKDGAFIPKQGPVFANIVLADEINRAPAKVQSALLEAMQEKQVTIGETTYKLPHPFLVLATQNPVEQEGTYPLPEAQVDRFMLKLQIDYPTREEERLILDRMADAEPVVPKPVVSLEQIDKARKMVRSIRMEDKIKDYIVDLVFATRNKALKVGRASRVIEYGASPRATISLTLAAKAYAFLQGRPSVFPNDVKSIARDVLRHRIAVTYEAEAQDITPDDVVEEVLNTVDVP